jgi:hypothetical protein
VLWPGIAALAITGLACGDTASVPRALDRGDAPTSRVATQSPAATPDPSAVTPSPARAVEPEPVGEPGCDAPALDELAKRLPTLEVHQRPDAVLQGLETACRLPPFVAGFLAMYDSFHPAPGVPPKRAPRGASGDRRRALERACPGSASIMAEFAHAPRESRTALLFERCNFARFDVVDAARHLRRANVSHFPFSTMQWLVDQQVAESTAREIARALVLVELRATSLAPRHEGLRLPSIDVPLPRLEPGVVVSLTATKVHLDRADGGGRSAGSRATPSAWTIVDGSIVDTALLSNALDERAASSRAPTRRLVVFARDTLAWSAVAQVIDAARAVGFSRAVVVTETAAFEYGGIDLRLSATAGVAPIRVRLDPEGISVDAPRLAQVRREIFPVFAIEAVGRLAAEFAEANRTPPAVVSLHVTEGVTVADVTKVVVAWAGPECAATGTDCRSAIALDGGPVKKDGPGPGLTQLGERGSPAKPALTTDPRPARVDLGSTTVRGSLSRDRALRVIKGKRGDVRRCYEPVLRRDPAVAGRVVVELVIASAGTPSGVKIVEDTLSDPSVATCIADAARRWPFPSLPGGGVAVVRAPFMLSAG